jgi:hypothetical protein
MNISAKVSNFDFQVCQNVNLPGRLRFVDLFLDMPTSIGINQVGIAFEERADFQLAEHLPNYIEVRAPISYLADTLYLLETFAVKNLEMDYDTETSRIDNFCLKSVNLQPSA